MISQPRPLARIEDVVRKARRQVARRRCRQGNASMVTRPACRSVEFAETFKDPSVVAAYQHRPPHALILTCSPVRRSRGIMPWASGADVDPCAQG